MCWRTNKIVAMTYEIEIIKNKEKFNKIYTIYIKKACNIC